MCKKPLEVNSNGFKRLADTQAGQKVGFPDNNGNHGDIFVGDSDECAVAVPDDGESSRIDRTIAVGNDSFGLSRQFAGGRRHNEQIGNGNGAIIEGEHVI